MKPFGLEGKVGAPAIVRTNPLLKRYDEEFAPGYKGRHVFYTELIVRSLLPFTWSDVLGVVLERYAGSADDCLSLFLTATSEAIPDRMLPYDLETPSLDVLIPSPDPFVDRLVLFRGSCKLLTTQKSVLSLIDGRTEMMIALGGVSVIRSAKECFNVWPQSSVLYAPIAGTDADVVPLVFVERDGVLLSSVPIDYRPGTDGVICDKDSSPDARALLDMVSRLPDDPSELLVSMVAVRDRFEALKSPDLFSDLRDRMNSCSIPADRLATHRRFVPGGVSR